MLPVGRAAGAVGTVLTNSLRATHGVSKRAVARLARQIEADGGIHTALKYVEDGGEKIVVDGNHRLRAARQLGIERVPAERVDLPYKGYKTVADLIYHR